ncbi:zinc-finger homeodomain protein 11-like [Abrus precatorius]|uniref:Zinc-finger homeodomain protein 11-like n=1 Tax=Abrus precatorius TaxID=3816 RepID=A0A8B8KW28_ABRPR|nr:zinc-finger homeodomain protein 11-like [Abrus precatorius]
MDLTNSSTTQTLDADTKPTPTTQPTNAQTSKSQSFTNGTLKRHSTITAPLIQPPPMVVSYKECLKNHAATIGGHALDGCGEFMPSSSTNLTDPRSLKCAACGCHRNFHRRDPQEHNNTTTNSNNNSNNNNPTFLNCIYAPSAPPPLPHRAISQSTSPSLSSSPSHSPSPMSSPSPPPLSHLPPSYHTSAPHMLLALGTAYSAPSSDDHHHHKSLSFLNVKSENPSGKKRYRTKFSKEQKEKMYSFSEKLGWRMQKGDDGLVQEFCNDIGVSRGIFKVWMHNNKNTFRKRSEVGNALQTEKINGDHDDGNAVGGGGGGGGGGGFDSDINNPYNPNSNNNDIHMNENDSCANVHVSLNELSA